MSIVSKATDSETRPDADRPGVVLAVPVNIVRHLATAIGAGKLRVVGEDSEGRVLLQVNVARFDDEGVRYA